jgi:hypothetical protein
MSGGEQNKAFFAVIGSIPKSIKYIAIFVNGQQGIGFVQANRDVISGASDDWRWDTDEDPTEPRFINGLSAAARFYHDQYRFLPQSETLYLSIWDLRFNLEQLKRNKEEMLEGYASFLNSMVDWNNVKGVVIAGASRGGCFALRLPQKLRSMYTLSEVKFALASIDGVCSGLQNEFGVTITETIDNPLPSAPANYKSYPTDVPAQLVGPEEDYCIWHLALGNDVSLWGLLGVRGFSHYTCKSPSCYLLDRNNNAFYTQVWDDISHKGAVHNFDAVSLDKTVTPILDHFEDCINRFGW